MNSTGLDVFDKTLQTTHVWLRELSHKDAIGPDKQLAWHALGAVLRAVRDQIPVELAAHLGAELPLLVRGTYYDQFRPEVMPKRERSREVFLRRISDELSMSSPTDVVDATQAVLAVLSHYLNPDQIRKVRDAMPADVRTIWPDPDASHSEASSVQ
ncbi:DUF2267 domain-containing protein [Mesorhizobium sp. Cs1299R1N1]|uniref:DUF2267 domain-containing protein n=1 Tax=Mesorhizobium sp. Cs1299R1N1 TaxID=3015172 RepID=UPI00301E1720